MRVHHLNCGTMCPPVGRLITPTRGIFERGLMVCHCLLIETDAHGLVLVDTGLGTEDVRDPKRLGAIRHLLASHLTQEETAVRQVERLGFSPSDVRHIVLTHLDLDHASGLGDFPDAKVHCMRKERDAAANPRGLERERYRTVQWAHDPEWALYDVDGERWFGFEAVRDLVGLPPSSSWSPSTATAAVTQRSPWTPRTAGSCTPATPTSSTARWIRAARTAHRVCAPFSASRR